MKNRPPVLEEVDPRARATLDAMGDGLIRTDSAGRIEYMNPAAERLTGWDLEKARGCDLAEVYRVISETHRRPRRNVVDLCLAEGRPFSPPGLFALVARDGNEYTVRDTVSPVVDDDGSTTGVVVVFRDLTHMRTAEREIAYRTTHDPLTGLLNRVSFERYLETALQAARSRKAEHTLLHLELMELTLINDCYGRVAGDELLRRLGAFLERELGDRAILGRPGGSELHVLWEGTPRQAQAMATELGKRLEGFRFTWGGQHFEIGFHLGLVGIDRTWSGLSQLLEAVDTAVDLARRGGRNNVYVFDPVRDGHERTSRLSRLQRLRRALAEDGFRLYHQRIESLSGGPALHEILVRMAGPEGELVSPEQFIPLAEGHEMAPLLDRWVIRKSLDVLGSGAVLDGERVTLNLSGQSLADEIFLQGLADLVSEGPVEPRRLYFEITETYAVANLSRALDFIEALREMGCRFVLDDFGTGFSSFAYLKNLPVDVLKIDGQFVRDIDRDPIARAMVASIHEIAHLMGLETIAEWVEGPETLDILKDMGVDYVQGFHLHRPRPLEPEPA